jgi:hypothetical protein
MHEQAQQQLQEQRQQLQERQQQLQAAEEQLAAERQQLAVANGRILRSSIMLSLSHASFLMIVGATQFLSRQPIAFKRRRDVVTPRRYVFLSSDTQVNVIARSARH